MGLEVGLERVDDFVVEDRLVTDIGGTIGVRVLSTPGMIGMMERVSSVEGRKLRFEVEVTEGDRTIGVGTHERRVIDVGAVKSA
jgi:fluoroacetyl-CoA thioesterase